MPDMLGPPRSIATPAGAPQPHRTSPCRARRSIARAIAAAAFAAPLLSARAAASRAVRLIVPFAPAQGSDVLARALGASLSAAWSQPVLVDNRPGANGTLAVQELVRAAADGHSVLVSSNSPIVINPNLYRQLSYRPEHDLAPLALLARADVALVAPRSLGAATLPELVARLREPGQVHSYASPGIGSTGHLYMLMLCRALGIELTHVPYKGSAPAMNDLLAGRVQLMFDGLASCMPHVRSGGLRVLAVAGARASRFLPEAPTTAALGIDGLPGQGWYGAFAHARTPPDALATLRAGLQQATADAALQAQLRALYLEPLPAQGDSLAVVVRDDLGAWERITRSLNLYRST